MRTILLALLLFALGLGAALLITSPRAGAHSLDGSLTGGVSEGSPSASLITLSASTVAAGTYTFDITDSATTHNFDLINPSGSSVDATSVSGTGTVEWTVDLTAGTWHYRCDAHPGSMTKALTVTGSDTSTTTTASTSTTAPTTTTTTTATTTAPTTTETSTTTATTSTSTTTPTTTTTAPLTVRLLSIHATRRLVTATVKATFLSHAVAKLLHKGKLVAETKGAAPGELRLKPSHALSPGRYVVRVEVKCCGTSATAAKTIEIR